MQWEFIRQEVEPRQAGRGELLAGGIPEQDLKDEREPRAGRPGNGFQAQARRGQRLHGRTVMVDTRSEGGYATGDGVGGVGWFGLLETMSGAVLLSLEHQELLEGFSRKTKGLLTC